MDCLSSSSHSGFSWPQGLGGCVCFAITTLTASNLENNRHLLFWIFPRHVSCRSLLSRMGEDPWLHREGFREHRHIRNRQNAGHRERKCIWQPDGDALCCNRNGKRCQNNCGASAFVKLVTRGTGHFSLLAGAFPWRTAQRPRAPKCLEGLRQRALEGSS